MLEYNIIYIFDISLIHSGLLGEWKAHLSLGEPQFGRQVGSLR